MQKQISPPQIRLLLVRRHLEEIFVVLDFWVLKKVEVPFLQLPLLGATVHGNS